MFKQIHSFFNQVLSEAHKLEGPSARDLVSTALRVAFVVFVASILLLGTDWIISYAVRGLLRI